MSAQTFIPFDRGVSIQQRALREKLRGLSMRLRLWRGLPQVAIVLAASTLSLGLLGVTDYFFPMPLAMRAMLLGSIAFTTVLFLLRAVETLARGRTLAESAREVERAAGQQENAVTTFAEVTEAEFMPQRRPANPVAPYMVARLQTQAQLELEKIEPRLFSSRRLLTLAAVSYLVAIGLLLGSRLLAPVAFAKESRRLLLLTADESSSATDSGKGAAVVPNTGDFEEVRLRIVPPRYTGLAAEEVSGESSVRALAGSRIEVRARLRQAVRGATLAFNGATEAMRIMGDGQYDGGFTANISGALELRAGENRGSIIRSIEVYPDAAPEARITQPVSDQLLPAVPAVPISVRWTGRDDLGLAAVTLRYVKSRGEGDAAKFSSGEVNLGPVEKPTSREWRGIVPLNLATLDVRPGDTLVYWIEARDHNPAAGAAGRSASMLIAIPAPDAPKLNLGELRPNEMGRFLLTQRLIINHTEKLNSARPKLSPEEFKARANDIAAEQRDFRNSFDDFIKSQGAAGEADDEQSIADRARAITDARIEVHDHGIPEPPAGAPAAVRDFIYAIRAMWDAEDQLVNASTIKALDYEREALARLKRAQAAVRYVPRVTAQTKPLDLKRRYAGELDEIKTRLERLTRRGESKGAGAIRSALADSYGALRDLQSTLGTPASARASRIAGAAKQTSRAAQGLLANAVGDHALTIAQAAGQLRVVESELLRLEPGSIPAQADFDQRLEKPLALLAQSISELFAIAERNTSAASGADPTLMPAYSSRAADYFRRLAEQARR